MGREEERNKEVEERRGRRGGEGRGGQREEDMRREEEEKVLFKGTGMYEWWTTAVHFSNSIPHNAALPLSLLLTPAGSPR